MSVMRDFHKAANDPQAWLRAADSLWGAAEELVGGPRFLGWYLLTGMAVEDTLKGVIVTRRRVQVDDRGRVLLPWDGSDHDLGKLAKRASIDLTNDDRDLLNRLSEFVKWAGRYPIPKRLEDFRPLFLSANDVTAARRMFGRLRARLEP